MGYYMRFIVSDAEATSIEGLRDALTGVDRRWRIEGFSRGKADCGDLYLADEVAAARR